MLRTVHRRAVWVVGDLRNVLRDPVLVLYSVIPVLVALLFRFAVPAAAELLRSYAAFDLVPWYPHLTGFLLLMSPLMIGTVYGFLFLDERDLGILTAVAVTPVSREGYLLARLAYPATLSVLLTLAVPALTGLVSVPLPLFLPTALLAAIEAPMAALFLAALAGNKVEGLTLSKLLSFTFLGPIAGFFLPWPWHLAGGLLPPYWVTQAFLSLRAGGVPSLGYLGAGFVIHLILLRMLFRFFRRRVS